MATELIQASPTNGTSTAHDLFALTDEQILQIEPDAQDIEIFVPERSDQMDPLRQDLDLLASDLRNDRSDTRAAGQSNGQNQNTDDGLKAVATNAAEQNARPGNAAAPTEPANAAQGASGEAPQWLAERMNDPQHGAEARELWQGVQAAHQEASAFREVFAKPEDARAAANRARMLDEIDRAYFGAAGNAPEQISASRAQLAAMMLREDPAAFREMVFASLRALENAGRGGNETVTPHFKAASSAEPAGPEQTPRAEVSSPQAQAQAPREAQRQQEARLAAYAAFERAANEELERSVGGVIERSLLQALPNAARTENGAALKQRLSAAVRQDVEKALQGDRALGEQVARILSGQRLDNTARVQVVRLIGDRAQQLVPGATRRVLADWTQTSLSAHGSRANRGDVATTPSTGPAASNTSAARHVGSSGAANANVAQKNLADAKDRGREAQRSSIRDAANSRSSRKIDYRRISDEDILDS